MSGVLDLLPGVYVLGLGLGLAWVLRRWYDPVPWRVLAVFGLVLAILFGPVLFGGGVLLPVDNVRGVFPFRHLPPSDPPTVPLQADLVHQIAPWTVEVRRALGAGHWPLWNVHAGAGMPLLGDPQTQVFQPLVVAAYPFPFDQAAGVTASLRVLVALVFGFLLLRRQGLGEAAALGGALAFGLGGFLLSWLGWPMANCPALLPAVLYAIARCDDEGKARDLFLLFLTTASLLLAGHPETLLYSMLFAGLFLLARACRRGKARLLVRCGLAMALAGAAVSPVLLPVLDYLPKTDRAAIVAGQLTPAPLGELRKELMRPETLELWKRRTVDRLVILVAPRAYGDHALFWGVGNVIESGSGFVGSAALLAGVLALLPLTRGSGRRRFPQERLAVGVLLACLLLMAQPPGLDRLLAQLPGIGAIAIHRGQRLLLLVTLCLAGLAACEVERRCRGEGARWPVIVAAAALAALVTWGYLAHPHPRDPGILAGLRTRMLVTHLVTLALAAVLLVLRPGARRGRAVPWLFCGLVAAELLLVHGPFFPPGSRRLAYPVTPPVRFLQEHLRGDRMLGIGSLTFLANFPVVYGLNDVRIDNPSLPALYAQATAPLRTQRPPYVFGRAGHPLYDLLGVRYLLTRAGVPLPFRRVFADPFAWIYERPHPLPRLFLPARAVSLRGGSWVAWLERNPDFARRALVLSGEGETSWRASRPRASRLDVAIPEPEHVHGRGRLTEPRLVASSVFQDGHWLLLAGGERRPTVLANGPFVAAWVPAGEQRIDLLYRPRVFVAGCGLAALALAAAAAWWVPRPVAEVG